MFVVQIKDMPKALTKQDVTRMYPQSDVKLQALQAILYRVVLSKTR